MEEVNWKHTLDFLTIWWLWAFSGGCIVCPVLLRMLIPVQSTFPTALLASHHCPEEGLGQMVPLSPCAQPNRRDVPAPEKLALNSALPFSWCFSAISTFLRNFSERGMLKLVCCIRGSSMWAESCLCYLCDAFGKQPEPGAVGWGEHLWARCHLEAVEYSWMIMAFLPSAAIWQAQRNADLSQSEIKHGT